MKIETIIVNKKIIKLLKSGDNESVLLANNLIKKNKSNFLHKKLKKNDYIMHSSILEMFKISFIKNDIAYLKIYLNRRKDQENFRFTLEYIYDNFILLKVCK